MSRYLLIALNIPSVDVINDVKTDSLTTSNVVERVSYIGDFRLVFIPSTTLPVVSVSILVSLKRIDIFFSFHGHILDREKTSRAISSNFSCRSVPIAVVTC